MLWARPAFWPRAQTLCASRHVIIGTHPYQSEDARLAASRATARDTSRSALFDGTVLRSASKSTSSLVCRQRKTRCPEYRAPEISQNLRSRSPTLLVTATPRAIPPPRPRAHLEQTAPRLTPMCTRPRAPLPEARAVPGQARWPTRPTSSTVADARRATLHPAAHRVTRLGPSFVKAS
jgi:hypothetical protein